MKSRSFGQRCLMVLLLVLFVGGFAYPVIKAYARAGSGNRYRSSRSSSSGGSSRRSSSGWGSSRRSGSRGGYSSGEGADIGEMVPILAFFFFLIVAIGVGYMVAVTYLPKKDVDKFINAIGKLFGASGTGIGFSLDDGQAEDFSGFSDIRIPQTRPVSLAPLKASDPSLDEKVFFDRVSVAFLKVQQAWSDQNLQTAEAFLSDGIYERFSLQLDEMRSRGFRDVMRDVEVLSGHPVAVEVDTHFQTVHVLIKARAVSYQETLSDKKRLGGSNAPEVFSEIWSFLRKPGATTSGKPGLFEGQCPNCGNPVKVGRVTQCDICQAMLRSGEYDWVLAEITQLEEWRQPKGKKIPGFEALAAADPAFNLQHIEDRASVIFWRKLAAERLRELAPIRKMASEAFCKKLEAEWGMASGPHRFFADCGVGSVDVETISVGEPMDSIFVRIKWSGCPTTSDKGTIQSLANSRAFSHMYVLRRRHGTVSEEKSALASSHCPACGAPEQSSAENACAYCGQVLNDGTKDWILDDVLS